ncbi:NAD(P)/FAD-dependent oxidoreductase [Actinobacteria bacterium YIM 96077]|uniref:NAD(P)/FAD-dependent oxidoreductase n=1 Tax=Phytoactinopolyspora halophila TaxID=1981511 RepID=A0A329QT57_9ACTN|nr:FAD/NAD(P)-binding oxidoreductase [Phytoactinopolyspora halophila]AYY14267.1 NAD(P)/FAD-dependent oxidoreductase [Actinobacteria bacterium YIM 96077]RAW14809.1 NAD(P)/FAD-dependent oxidoreductase [Phytoactinopolyspora halophila]
MAHVLVLGGGFGGLAAAHELRRRLPPGDDITVVATSDRFFVGFAKLWDLVGFRPLLDGVRPLERLDERGIRFVRAEVTAIDPATRTVQTTAGTLTADGLVVALGATYQPAHAAQLHQDAYNLYHADALPGIRAALSELTSGRLLVCVLGTPYLCPPAPFEATLLLDEWLRARGRRAGVDVAVSTPAQLTLPVAGDDANRYLAGELKARDITVLTDHAVESIDPDARQVRFRGGQTHEWELLLAVPAAAPPPVVAESPLAGSDGWIEPDRHTFATDADRVYAAGDCTLIRTATAQLPKAGVFAEAAGRIAAANLATDLYGGDRPTFDGYGYCFLELPGQRVATVTGDFYAEPEPAVRLALPDDASFRAKQQWEQDRLTAWLGTDPIRPSSADHEQESTYVAD